ncbi:MAG: DUF4250 domain-containing protein [Lachnospiraceae bacterium]|nr:DUF4250 domain-containing protein [Lachnospiraceae bacterium]MDD3794526.1 DUF4250 domain-containing protein [Lachnospiraceae bacterium]
MIPKDPVMLLSYVNMKLRDEKITPAELCRSQDLDYNGLIQKLRSIDYEYDSMTNQFI